MRMKLRRRSLLIVLAIGVLIVDAVIVIRRSQDHSAYAPIIYVGMDSLVIDVSASVKGATLTDGRWSPALAEVQIPAQNMSGQLSLLTLVDLSASSPYGNFLEVIRKLRSERKCNVLIREGGEESAPHPFGHPRLGSNYISALVLCGDSIGDAGVSGTLPADGLVRLYD